MVPPAQDTITSTNDHRGAMSILRITKTSQELMKAQVHDLAKEHAIAMLHLNAACVFAREEFPEWKAQAIRYQAERYRAQHFPRRSNAEPHRISGH